jgi:hypothetical protein
LKHLYIFSVFVLLIVSGCSTQRLPATATTNDYTLYQYAMADAAYAQSSEIYSGLTPITKDNPKLIWKTIDSEDYLLVVTWKQKATYYHAYLDSAFYDTGNYQIWVTAAPELLSRMTGQADSSATKRLVQLLGLPPNSAYNYFVEMWVRPQDLFRPCPDAEITDTQCGLCFPADAALNYITWFNSSRIDRYYNCELYKQYPWTQLGYTYDWNPANKTHIGLSEFVVDAHKKVKINAIYSTQEYLAKAK